MKKGIGVIGRIENPLITGSAFPERTRSIWRLKLAQEAGGAQRSKGGNVGRREQWHPLEVKTIRERSSATLCETRRKGEGRKGGGKTRKGCGAGVSKKTRRSSFVRNQRERHSGKTVLIGENRRLLGKVRRG